MKNTMTTMTKTTTGPATHAKIDSAKFAAVLPSTLLAALVMVLASPLAVAQNLTVTPGQRATAQQVAQAGVPLSELAPNAPDSHLVKRGDTLWAISGLFLKSPWRWPELWGMNLEDIKNPHRIYPGQQLYLERKDGRATLRTARSRGDGGIETVRVSPRTRFESLADEIIPTLKSQFIEPFLAEPVVVGESELNSAPRIVAAQEERVLLTRGDRAYARGPVGQQLAFGTTQQNDYRVFRNATPLKDPISGEVLGYEAQYVGKAQIVRGESRAERTDKDGKVAVELVPATIDIVSAKEEMRVGDRLLPEPARQFTSYAPRAPLSKVDARVVSVYGSSVVNAGQNQVVAINRGSKDGVESGHVLAILKAGAKVTDKTVPSRDLLQLPDERNGLLMVFRTFDRVSYALILDITQGVKVGDRLANPN